MGETPGIVGPFVGMDVRELLRIRAKASAEKPFLIWAPFDQPSRTWSYAEFDDAVGRLAAGLIRRGVKERECLLIHLDNCIEAMIAWFACTEIGAIAVTTNTRSAPAEVKYFADHCGAVASITQPAYAEIVAGRCKGLKWVAVIDHDAGAEPASTQRPERTESFSALFADVADAPRRAPDPMAPCSVQYTSGTTSRPKAVLWTHANALWGAKINSVHENLRETDRHLITLPLFHTNALAYSMLATLWVGCSVVIQPRFSASRFWPVVAEHQVTWTSMVPFCVKALADREIPKDHSFRMWGMGVSQPPSDAVFGVRTIGWWGMTETITHGIIGDPYLPNVPLSIGRPAPEYTVRVTNDDGSPTEIGGSGNLLLGGVPGLSLFKEYLYNEKATRESYDEDGFFITGDRVDLLEDGSIRFGDRVKDMLKVGGENVAASEIEAIASAVPGAREVAIVSKKHAMLDEVPVLFVIPMPDQAERGPALIKEIEDACANSLADFKRPREIRLVDSMPRSTLEKIDKKELRRQLEDNAQS